MDFYPNNRFNERELSKRGAYEISIVEQSFITVGIGASAGGLEAFKVLFEFISVDAGLSSSALNETVTLKTRMEMVQLSQFASPQKELNAQMSIQSKIDSIS